MSKRILTLGAVAVIGCLALASVASAGEPRTHDGFFLRLSAGPGFAGSEIDFPGASVELSGAGGDANFAIGGMVRPNLAVHGTLWSWALVDPDADVTVAGFGSASGEIDGTVTMSAVGAGITYYWMPSNMYFTTSLGFGSLELDTDDLGDAETDSGLVLDLGLGKEWWVSDSWGLGLSGGFSFHSIPDPAVDENWTGAAFGVRFSASFN